MDVFLASEAFRFLSALNLIYSNQSSEGLIIGHKRGHRYFVERVYLFPRLFSYLPKKFFELNRTFDNKLIGFWGYNLSQKKIDKILSPFACGKLFFQVGPASSSGLNIKSFVVDYKEKFYLSPLQLKL